MHLLGVTLKIQSMYAPTRMLIPALLLPQPIPAVITPTRTSRFVVGFCQRTGPPLSNWKKNYRHEYEMTFFSASKIKSNNDIKMHSKWLFPESTQQWIFYKYLLKTFIYSMNVLKTLSNIHCTFVINWMAFNVINVLWVCREYLV